MAVTARHAKTGPHRSKTRSRREDGFSTRIGVTMGHARRAANQRPAALNCPFNQVGSWGTSSGCPEPRFEFCSSGITALSVARLQAARPFSGLRGSRKMGTDAALPDPEPEKTTSLLFQVFAGIQRLNPGPRRAALGPDDAECRAILSAAEGSCVLLFVAWRHA